MKKSTKRSPKLSIIVLSYNTRDLLDSCLTSLKKVRDELKFEVIVVDNASIDKSASLVKENYPWVHLIESKENLGFSKGNNLTRGVTRGKYILFLNSDTEVYKNTLKQCVEYYDKNPNIGALTCKLVLPNGTFDKDTIRSFPTPWVALTHFSGLDRIFPHSKIFSRYWYGFLDKDKIQKVEAIQGAFFMSTKKLLDRVGWFDPDYFLDGEDIDLSWKTSRNSIGNMYFPKVTILHIKKASKKGKRSLSSIMAGVNSMELFYRKNLWDMYPYMISLPVILGIKALKVLRYLKYIIQ